MHAHSVLRVEPSPEVLERTRTWLGPVRGALGSEFLAAYLTGSVLTTAFHPKRSAVNLLVVSRTLSGPMLDALTAAVPAHDRLVRVEPMFLTQRQIEKSLDVFPIEWLEITERHLLLEGEDVVGPLEVPLRSLRLQCEHELRGKHIRLRQAFLTNRGAPPALERELQGVASSFATLFRTLLRLRGEPVPADSVQVIERTADLFRLDAQSLLGAHLLRYSEKKWKPEEIATLYRGFLAQIDRLIEAIDELRLP
jgi:hypothetical protein